MNYMTPVLCRTGRVRPSLSLSLSQYQTTTALKRSWVTDNLCVKRFPLPRPDWLWSTYQGYHHHQRFSSKKQFFERVMDDHSCVEHTNEQIRVSVVFTTTLRWFDWKLSYAPGAVPLCPRTRSCTFTADNVYSEVTFTGLWFCTGTLRRSDLGEVEILNVRFNITIGI